LVFILALDSRSHKNYFDELKLPIQPINLVTPEQVQQTFRRDSRNICVVFSDRAGIGKTEYIREQADKRYDKRILTVPVGDGASRLSFATNLSSMSPRQDECFHFDVSDIEDRRGINLAFFEILALGCLQVGSTVLNVPRDIVCFIEIANTYSAGLRNALTILNYFNQHHLQWSLGSLVVSQEKNCDLQIVCNYLKHLKAGDLATHEIVLIGASCNVEVLQKPEVLVLMKEYFFDYLEENSIPATLNVMYVFLGVLADQLRRFSKSVFFRIRTMKDYASTRQNIVGSLVEHCREFATRSLAAAKSKQDSSMLNDIVDFMPTGLVRWEDNNQVMVLMHTQGSITALYRDSTSLDGELKTIMESQINKRRGDQLPDYFSMSSEELKIQLSKFAYVPSDNDEANAYVLTPDNFLKIVMIFVRVDAGLPVILMGETGVCNSNYIYIYYFIH
jgi:E3 ubiquitin-protein ligase RNF213